MWWRRKQRVIRKPFCGGSDQVALGADSHLLRLGRRRLGEASGIIGTTAEVGRLGAGLNHFGCCWCDVGGLRSSVLVLVVEDKRVKTEVTAAKAMSEEKDLH